MEGGFGRPSSSGRLRNLWQVSATLPLDVL